MRMETWRSTRADFQKWLDNQLEPYTRPDEGTLAAEGEATFIASCSRCHQVDGLSTTTPTAIRVIVGAPTSGCTPVPRRTSPT